MKASYRRLNDLTQHVLIGASRRGEMAREDYNGHGVFTAALLETLARKPDPSDEKTLNVDELNFRLRSSIDRITRSMAGPQQRLSSFGDARFPLVAR